MQSFISINRGIVSGRSWVQIIHVSLWRKRMEKKKKSHNKQNDLYFDWGYFEVCIVCLGNSVLGVNQPLCVSHYRQDTGQPWGSRFGSRDVRLLETWVEVKLFLGHLGHWHTRKNLRESEALALLFHTVCFRCNF